MKTISQKHLASLLGGIVWAEALAVLIGWRFGIGFLRAPVPNLTAMKPNTAVGLMFLGLSLILLSRHPTSWLRWVAVTCMGMVWLLGSATLLEYISGRSFGIDLLFFFSPTQELMGRFPGRPSPQTSINLFLLSSAMGLCILTQCSRVPGWIVQSIAAVSLIFSFIASVGFIFAVTFFYGVTPNVGMALHTAFSFALLAIGVLFLTSDTGFLSEIFSSNLGGRLARQVLPATLLVPLLSAVVLCTGEHRGLYTSATTIACLIVICTLLPAAVAVGQLTRFNRQETEQQRAREQMQLKSEQLALEQAARTAAELGSERYRQLAEERDRLLLSETAARERAEEATKAKDNFLAILSHELRTPLTPVLLIVSLIERQPLSEQLRQDIQIVRENIETEARLIDDLLDLTRIVHHKLRLQFESVDLHQMIREIVGVPGSSDPSPNVLLQLSAGGYKVSADPIRLRQVFFNLLNNSRKFTPPAGSITVATQSDDRIIRVRITDTGVGIDPGRLTTIFEAFDQGNHGRRFNTQAGLGLGLTISRGLVEAHGGTITACSAGVNQGATFEVELPLERYAARGSAAVKPPLKSQSPAASLRILLVEDHPATMEVMARLLKRSGHQVVTAGSVKEAAAVGAERQFDLLISDLGLPDGSGHDVMRQIRALLPNQNIVGIAVSGYGMEGDFARSRHAGFAEHLVKPIDLNVLNAAIKRHSAT